MREINHKDTFRKRHLALEAYAGAPQITRRVGIHLVDTDVNEV